MKHQCHISVIYLTWAFGLGGLAFLLWNSQWLLAGVWALAVPLAEWLYIRNFPRVAPLMGYGSVSDQPAGSPASIPARITLYVAAGCPFCPLMEERLAALKRKGGFEFDVVDVTLRPNLLLSKGIRSVPALEVGGELFPGLLTTARLAAILDAAHSSNCPAIA